MADSVNNNTPPKKKSWFSKVLIVLVCLGVIGAIMDRDSEGDEDTDYTGKTTERTYSTTEAENDRTLYRYTSTQREWTSSTTRSRYTTTQNRWTYSTTRSQYTTTQNNWQNYSTTRSSTYTTKKPTTTTKATTKATTALPHAKNVYADGKNSGACKTLLGNVCVTVVFANDPSGSWTSNAIAAEKKELESAARKLESEAKRYGKTVKITFRYVTGTGTQVPEMNDKETFVKTALKSAGLPEKNTLNPTLKKQYGCDEAPVVFCLNHQGRSFANWGTNAEIAVLFQDEYNPFMHELLHLFGADDFYYPADTKKLAEQLLAGSVMINSSDLYVDPLTAYLVGWMDKPTGNAETFLAKTDHITNEMMKAEYEKNSYTGYVTNYDDGYGYYTGNLVSGVRQGKGKITWYDGSTYDGEWNNGQKHGYGKSVWANGDTYVGEWKNHLMHGQGTYVWTNGNTYTGQWENNKKSGQGKFTWKSSGFVYDGNWINDVRQGKGTMFFDNGKYVGDWKDGERTGYGVYYWNDGSRHEGQWLNGNRHGSGVYYNADGSVRQKGTWKDDKFAG